MSPINGVGGSSDAWAQMRSQMQANMFKKVDANDDGGVDKTELKSMLSDISKTTGKSIGGDINDTFAKMDSNSDSKLSIDELAKGMENLLPPPSTMEFAKSMGGQNSFDAAGAAGSLIDDLFSKMDSNGDASLDKSELKIVAAKIMSDTGMDLSDKLNKLADNNGGKVSKDLFHAALEREGPSGPPPAGMGGSRGPGGPGGPSGPGGAARPGGAESVSKNDKTYDKLDTNQDGTVSQLERLVGELKNKSSNKGGVTEGYSDVSSKQSSSLDMVKLVKQMYEQFSESFSEQQGSKALSALA